jgi:hypothetical protein
LGARLLAAAGAVALVSASVVLTVPAYAGQPDHGRSDNGQAHSAQGQALKPATSEKVRSHRARGGSTVALPRPNGFQAQADPDGMANGGVDQPGGTGGVDPTTQDGNNGSGNDVDCEDDNRGVGVPGHCRPKPVETPDEDGTAPEVPGGTDPAEPETQVTDLVTQPMETVVSAPTGPTVQAGAFGTSAPPAATAARTGVLPDTGAGQALLGLAVAAVAALGVGAGLVRQGRRAGGVSG